MKSKELAQVLIRIVHQTEKPDKAVSAFLSFLETNNLAYQLPLILRYVEQFQMQEKQAQTLVIESPFEIDTSLQKKIQTFVQALDAQYVELDINKKLLGGFRTSYKGLVTDASIRHNLLTLKKQLTK